MSELLTKSTENNLFLLTKTVAFQLLSIFLIFYIQTLKDRNLYDHSKRLGSVW